MKDAPPLTLFGVPRWVPPQGDALVFTAERPCQLLAVLAVRRAWVPRDDLATLFWPDRPQSAARSNLRKVLLLAQRRVAPSTIEQRHELLRWAPDSDLARFVDRAEDDEPALPPAPLLEGIEAGLGQTALAWLDHERRRIEAQWHAATLRRLSGSADDPAVAAPLAQQLLDHDPLDEEALAAGIDAWLALAQPARARLALDAHRAALSTQLGLAPGPALRVLDERVRAAGIASGAAPAPAAAGASPAAAAPRHAGDFVGRRLEIAQCVELHAQDGCRLLTLLGPGGVGKTRLLRAAHDSLAAARPDAVMHWVALEDLSETDAVARRIAQAFALEPAATDPWAALASALVDRQATLLLDNAEHLGGLGAAMTTLLAAAPALKIVATSRMRLHVDGEWLLPLQGLPLPDTDEFDVEVLERSDSIRLFEQAARAVSPGYDWRRDVAAVVRLVHAVEGLPLALLLAANWVRMMPTAEIAAELEASIELLDSGTESTRRDVSLRASFQHSWHLLAPAERAHLASLAQLPGPFDRAMAAQVCDTPIVVLGALVDKSLLRAEGAGRFSLHPLIRQCTLDTATPSADDALRRRHAAHVARWLWEIRERRTLARVGLDVVERDWPHVRDAWRFAIAERDADFVYAAGSTVMFFLELRALWNEGRAMMRAGADAFDEGTLGGRRAIEVCLRALARFEYRAGRMDEAERHARRGLRLARRLGDTNGLKAHLNTLGIVRWLRGEFAQARPYFERSLAVALRDGDQTDVRGFQMNLAMLDYSLGRYGAGLRRMQELLPATRAGSDPFALVNLLTTMAASELGLLDWTAALERAQEGLALMQRHGFAMTRGEALLICTRALRALGRADEAAARAEEALALGRAGGESAVTIEALLQQALLALDAGERDGAAVAVREAAALALSAGTAHLRWRCVSVDALWCAAAGDGAGATAMLRRAIAQRQLEAVERDEARRWLAALPRTTTARQEEPAPDVERLLDQILQR